MLSHLFFFFFNDTATTEIYTRFYTLSLHDALPIYGVIAAEEAGRDVPRLRQVAPSDAKMPHGEDRKSTRLTPVT